MRTWAEWFILGQQQFRRGKYSAALKSFDCAIALQPNYDIWKRRAETLKKLKRYEEAKVANNQAIAKQLPPIADKEAKRWFTQGIQHLMSAEFEAAIVCYDQVIKLGSSLCAAWLNRSLALQELERYEEALAGCDRALESPSTYDKSFTFGVVLFSRASVLIKLERYEDAVLSCDQAIQFEPYLHEAWVNRGEALERLERYEDAILSYDRALEIQLTPNALAGHGSILGRLGQYEDAIAYLDRALNIQADFHSAWSRRGNILLELGEDEAALASFEQAVAIYQNDSAYWVNCGLAAIKLRRYDDAIANFNQGLELEPNAHEVWGARGVAFLNSGRCEEAIVSFDHALSIKPDHHQSWINRGLAAGCSEGREEPLASALLPEMQNPTLDQRGYEGRLASLQEGFRYVAQDTEGWALLHYSIGDAHQFQARISVSPRPFWRKAATSYKTALRILTPDRFLEHHLDVRRDLVRVLYALQETDEAQLLQRDGSDLLRRLLCDSKPSSRQQRDLLIQQANFEQISVDLAVQAGDNAKAFELAEHGKNTCLRWMLGLDEVIPVTYTETQRWLPQETAILYWHLSHSTVTTFIILPGQEQPLVVPAPDNLVINHAPSPEDEPDTRSVILKQLLAWEAWIREWNQDYQSYSSKKDRAQSEHSWRTSLRERLDALRQILNLDAIADLLKDHAITQLILVPHRALHRFPLHAFFPLPCTYLPSVYFGLTAPLKLNDSDQLLLIENPKTDAVSTGGGTFIEIESALVQRLFPTQVVEGEAATAATVHAALLRPHRIFHFSGHAAYNSHNPAQSCLYLAGSDQITLHSLAHLDLSAYDLICLAACETAVTGNQTISDEYVGLNSAFLRANASQLISSFWRVESAASAYFIVEFYRAFRAGATPGVALHTAQAFLINATCQDLITWIETVLPDLPKACQIALREERQRLADSTIEQPYADPYYWTAFSITGLGL